MKRISTYKKYFFILLVTVVSCDDFIVVDPPRTDLIRKTVFENDQTAEAAMTDIYHKLKESGFASGSTSSISLLASLSSDDLQFYGSNSVIDYKQFNDNTLKQDNFFVTSLWNGMYNVIYKANAIIEGLNETTTITETIRNRLLGEAKFARAFCHFYLVNLWGDVPLVLGTDYKINDAILRTPAQQVYDQIIFDLKEARDLLPDDYLHANNERTRVNKGAAAALLARVYLYVKDWSNAENEATMLIENTGLYALETDLASVFRTTSKEAIFQLWSDQYPNEFITFLVHPAIGPRYGALRPELAESFENGDLRESSWIETVLYGEDTYYRSFKYQSYAIPPDDYSTVLRLSEQYLIRAEARAQQNKLEQAASDINVIRNRAGLASTSSQSQNDLLTEVMNQRRWEFFAEWGHRWFDLKRTEQADQVLDAVKPEWNPEDALYPIPEIQLINNPGITQNPQ
jgi:starch-binding outer membrane protein, SusD/RagB family